MADIRLSPDPAAAFAALAPADQQRIIADLKAEANGTSRVTLEVVGPGVDGNRTQRLRFGAASPRMFGAIAEDAFDIAVFSGGGCKTIKGDWNHYSALGTHLLNYWSKTRWCYDGTLITNDPYFTRGGTAYHWPWFFRGHIDESTSGGKGETTWRDFTEGRFESCPNPNIGCIAELTPEISKTVHGDGTYSK